MSKLYVDELHPKTTGKQVVRPDLPAFLVGITSTYSHTVNTVVTYNTTDGSGGYNQGNHFDLANNKFIAPVDGIYSLFAQGMLQNGEETRAANMILRVNDASLDARYTGRGNLDGTTTGSGSYLRCTGEWSVKLNAGDEVKFLLHWETDGGSDGFDSTENLFNHGTYATGHLVG